MPFFSIIIPVYNTAPFLHDCLDSILNQTIQDWECICVDDGSKDDSLQILNEYQKQDNRFRVLHQENKGQSEARNLGLENVHGDFFSFVDSDDILLPNTLEIWKKALDETHCDVCFDIGQLRRFHQAAELDLLQQKVPNIELLSKYYSCTKDAVQAFMIERGSCGTTVNKIYRTSKLSDLRFNPNLSYAEDSTYYL